jgi:hypothetical protein
MVTGIRQDAWANAHRIPNEEPKPAEEQGKYLHPELFGAGRDQSISAKFQPQSGAESQNAAATGADSGSDSDAGSGSPRHVETGQK